MHKRPPSLPSLFSSSVEMEGGKGSSSVSAGSSSSSSSASSSRWNPTKEQISVLEGLYRQGIRTPSAEQIQHITGKLREYGHIEGKNVFYWFQNHKARQRQKQKQESFAYFSRLLHHHHAPSPPPLHPLPTFPSPPTCTNVACSPYYVPVPQVGRVAGFYQPQYPNVFLPVAAKRTDFERMELIQERNIGTSYNRAPYYAAGTSSNEVDGAERNCPISHETLPLFPLHPTGILEERSEGIPTSAGSMEDVEEEVGSETSQALRHLFGGPKKQC